jgi:putative mRNA 3-end processing factor
VTATRLLDITERGLYCPAGDFYIDPWLPVERAVITHAHADHARPGMGRYLTARAGLPVLRLRLGEEAVIDALAYGETLQVNEARVSLHPAGHIVGSAQVRIEVGGEACVVSGDYKLEADPTCAAFEPVRCHTFVTESTFGLPIYRWRPQAEVFANINAWWRANQEAGKATLIFAYALGKAQRVLAGVDASIGPLCTHGAVEKVNAACRAAGVALPPTQHALALERSFPWERALIVAPPSAQGTPWLRRFGTIATGFVSGWMQIRGSRRRRAVDRGFVLSDHADWPALVGAVRGSGAEQVWVTHGYSAVLARWLGEQGLEAGMIPTRFEGELNDAGDDVEGEA